MEVVAGPSSPLLASRIAGELGAKPVKAVYRKFPDGELYARIQSKEDKVLVVQSINSNDDLVFLMLIFDALEGKEITAVIPYMGYARQDKKFREGEAISIRAVAKMIEEYAERIISVNVHSREASGFFKKLEEIDAMPLIGKYYENQDVVMISPDFGSYERVKVAAKTAGCEFDYMEKIRIDAEKVEIKPKNIDVEGKKVVLVDDIISTGGTMAEAARMLGDAEKIEAACIHAVLAGYSLNKLYSSGISEIVATDTVERSVSSITVAELIVGRI